MDKQKLTNYLAQRVKPRVQNCNGSGCLVLLSDVVDAVADYMNTENITQPTPRKEEPKITAAYFKDH